jgi:hypothetical protein
MSGLGYDYGFGFGIGDVVDPYWPVVGVTKPQHLWPFSQTGDYTDHGSTGGLTLTPGGTGNSFLSGLVLNGSGYATLAYNADICNLGSIYSILLEYSYIDYTQYQNVVTAGVGGSTNGYDIISPYGGTYKFNFRTTPGNINAAGFLVNGVVSQVVISVAGTGAGQVTAYVNGVPQSLNSNQLTALTDGVEGFVVGANILGTSRITGTIKRVAILKGTAWSALDVVAIYAGLL